MIIFDKQIFGEDAQQWLQLSKADKNAWILANTNQADEAIIEEFISNPKITKDAHCLDCRDKKEKITIKSIVKKKK